MTKREVLTKAIARVDVFTDEEREVLQKMIDGLDRKSSKPTKAQIENVGYKNDILELIADGHARTAKQIGEALGLTTNKVSALLRTIILDGKGTKIPGAKTKDAPTYVGVEGAEPYAEGENA